MKKFYTTILCILLVLAALNTLTSCDGAKDYSTIDNAMASTKARTQFPMDIGNGIHWTDMVRENGYVVFSYTVNEDPITPEMMVISMKASPDQIKAQLKQDPLTAMAKKVGLGMKMVYTGEKSGSKAEFTIECNDL